MVLSMSDQALAMLRAAGAETIEHPGGTLFAHLRRVSALLATWEARPALVTAGLCHAFYGTDGFAIALLDVERRAELAAAIGEEAEELVYFYGACDRRASYGAMADPNGEVADRFTGLRGRPTAGQRQDFAELTAANELDIVAVSAEMRERYGAGLLELFTRWRSLLSEAAWGHVVDVLGRS
jgi:hypothetical protein